MTITLDEATNSMQVLEEALTTCKFGKFHWKLLAATLCATFASMMTVTTSSYILPAAECDLKMSSLDKGMLNAMPFIGQAGFTLFAGFLVDGFGRKVFLVWGNIGIFLFTILEGSSQNYWMLMTMKFAEGISLSLSLSAISPMFAEFIPRDLRDRLLLVLATFKPLSFIVAALLSWALLPRNIHLVVLDGYFELHAWNIYLYVSSVWSIAAVILYYQLPESPKFLLSHGQEDRALEVLRTIYTTNTGESGDNFLIGSLTTVRTHTDRSVKRRLVRELSEVRSLLDGPLLRRLMLLVLVTFICMSTYISLRLWYPQLSTTIENYHKEHEATAGFCDMLQYRKHNVNITSGNQTDVCIPQISGKETYLNAILMGFTSLTFLGISVLLVDYVGQKYLMLISLILSAVCSTSLYWTNSSIQIAILFSATCSFLQLTLSLIYSIFVRVFPTTLRALALSIDVMGGRIGSLLGNIIFPILLEMNCMAPFITISAATLCVAGLTYFLPNPKRTGNVDK